MSLENILLKLESYRLHKHERNFQESTPALRQFYWHIIRHVIRHNLKNQIPFRNLIRALNDTYFGTFYKAAELHQAILNKFDNLPRYEWDTTVKQREVWIKKSERIFSTNFQFIQQTLRTPNLLKQDAQVMTVNYNDFDNYQIYLNQAVSVIMKNNLEKIGLDYDYFFENNKQFNYKFTASTLNYLDECSQKMILRSMILKKIEAVDQYFSESNSPVKKNKFISQQRFSTIQEALEHYLALNPKKQYDKGVTTITHELSVFYRSTSNNLWTKDAIRKVVAERIDSQRLS